MYIPREIIEIILRFRNRQIALNMCKNYKKLKTDEITKMIKTKLVKFNMSVIDVKKMFNHTNILFRGRIEGITIKICNNCEETPFSDDFSENVTDSDSEA
jgi:hypothetical protein